MRASTRRELVAGPAGRIECAVDAPEGERRDGGSAARGTPSVAALTFGGIHCAFDSTRGTRDELAPRAGAHLHPQPLDDTAVLEVLLDDLVDVGLVDVGVPDRVGVDDNARAFLAAVEAARLVD